MGNLLNSLRWEREEEARRLGQIVREGRGEGEGEEVDRRREGGRERGVVSFRINDRLTMIWEGGGRVPEWSELMEEEEKRERESEGGDQDETSISTRTTYLITPPSHV